MKSISRAEPAPDAERCIDICGSSGWRCYSRKRYGEYCGTHAPERIAERKAKRGPNKAEREAERQAALEALILEARWTCDNRDNCEVLREALRQYDALTPEG